MTNIELQAYRRFFMLKVSEASEYIGNSSAEVWHEWEQGKAEIPAQVIDEMRNLKTRRQNKIAAIIADINNRIGSNNIRYFLTFEDFKKVNPSLSVLDWRLHQSIATELYFRGLEKLC
ncbi:YdiL family protein [Orbus sasakiae]|uniref:YdiL family protein n=1 Tax=Orbus sasakiae TaxID=1078475 RepID=A0ABP9N5L7_9GAMM